MPTASSSPVESPPSPTVPASPQPTDYHTHPNTPSWVLDIHNRLDANEAKMLAYDKIFAENLVLKESLLIAQSKIADLEQELIAVATSSSSFNSDAQAITPEPAAKSVSFSEPVTTSSPSTYAGAASSPPRLKYFRSKQAAARSFLPLSSSQGFQYLYFFSRGREPYSVTRSKLSSLGISSNRVLDIDYPTNQIIGLLVHNDYAKVATDLLQKSGITLKTDFSPLSAEVIKDPDFATKTTEEKESKALSVHQKRLCNTLKRIAYITTRVALAKAFLAQKWITDLQYTALSKELQLPPLKPPHSSMEE